MLFGTAAAATVLAANALSNYAKTLSKTTSLAGTVLLASATTLPELTTSISAVSLGNPDIAIGNMLGSNMFNFFIIASADIWYRKIRLYQSANHKHIYTAILTWTYPFFNGTLSIDPALKPCNFQIWNRCIVYCTYLRPGHVYYQQNSQIISPSTEHDSKQPSHLIR